MRGETDAVEQSLRRLEEKYPLKLEVLQLRASLAAVRGDYASAEQLLSQARVTHKSHLLEFFTGQDLLPATQIPICFGVDRPFIESTFRKLGGGLPSCAFPGSPAIMGRSPGNQ